ncbi:patatin-like phospholipase family protein [Lewinella cohaerens]|uniref:patatin-like phospholipase family protein n=1 Tax=Lewinella cohaerens TaxID=70995 RepID=UPI00037A2574|nr:patatin-like phospholipase family protein [Lewinella cohaerens]
MRLHLVIIVTIFCTLQWSLAPGAMAQTSPPPKLGIALSGGGAKGLAHIGVLKVLEENGIFPDYLAGTSMGSIVGGLYAIGYTPAQLEHLATTLQWSDYFNDSYPRNYLPIDERNKADRYQFTFALEDGNLKIPRGLIGGKKILTLFTGLTACVHDVGSFDKYYCPFSCVATDLETGEAFVFKEGPLRKGIRASMSIPSAFDPLVYDDKILVDGLLARNLPVSDALDMGADIVIGVDVGDALYPREELTSVLRVLEQTSSYVMAASTEEQRALANFIIDPDLGDFTTLSYDAAPALIKQGEKAALAALPQLQSYLDSVNWKTRPIPERPNCRRDSFPVKHIEHLATDSTTQKTLAQMVDIKTPTVITIKEIEKWISILYATGFYSMIDYELVHASGGGYILRFAAESTPNIYVRGSINYDVDFNAGLLINFTARNQLGYGSILSADLRVSEYPGFWLDYTINTRTSPSFGLRLYSSGQIIPGELFLQNEPVSEFTFHHYNIGLDLQTNLSRQWHFRLGAGGEHFSENPRFFSLTELDARAQRWLGYGQLIRDTYDRTYFPEDGSLSQLWFEYNLAGKLEEAKIDGANFSTDRNWTIGGKVHKAFQLGQHLWLDASAGAGHSQMKEDHSLLRFYLGREIPNHNRFYEVYGFRLSEQRVSTFGFGRIQLRAEIGNNNFIALGYNQGFSSLIVDGKTLEENDISGVGLELGSVTTLGPLRFTAEYNLDFERFNFSLFAGYRF